MEVDSTLPPLRRTKPAASNVVNRTHDHTPARTLAPSSSTSNSKDAAMAFDQCHRRTDSVTSVSSAASEASTSSFGSLSYSTATSSCGSEGVHVETPTLFRQAATPLSPPLSPCSPGSPGGRRHSVGLNLAPSLCDFNPSPHRPPPRPQLRPLILAAKYPLDPMPLL